MVYASHCSASDHNVNHSSFLTITVSQTSSWWKLWHCQWQINDLRMITTSPTMMTTSLDQMVWFLRCTTCFGNALNSVKTKQAMHSFLAFYAWWCMETEIMMLVQHCGEQFFCFEDNMQRIEKFMEILILERNTYIQGSAGQQKSHGNAVCIFA